MKMSFRFRLGVVACAAILSIGAFSFISKNARADQIGKDTDKANNGLEHAEKLVSAHDCAKTIVVRQPEGAIGMVLLRSEEKEELVSKGATACGPWSPWGLYADECKVLTSRMRSRNCSKTDVYQKKHICVYVPSAAWVGWVGYAEQSHDEGDSYNKTRNWVEEEFDYAFGSWGHIFATNATLREAITSITTGEERTVNYTDKRATAVVGTPFSVVQDSTVPTQIASIRYFIDGREVTLGGPASLRNVGESTAIAELRTRSGGMVKFVVPFDVIKPVTIEETIRKDLGNGEVQYDIKIRNNNKTHPSLAWVSVSPSDRAGFSANLQGPMQYSLPVGDSTVVSVVARPTNIRPSNRAQSPGVFEFIVTSPTAGGVIADKARLTVDSAPKAQIATANGLHTISFDTLNGRVIVNLPDDIRAGDTISGTVVAEPKGNTAEERKTNAEKLSEFKLNFAPRLLDPKHLVVLVTPRIVQPAEPAPPTPNVGAFTVNLPDTFDYRIDGNAPGSDTQTVTVTISSPIWFVNNQAPSPPGPFVSTDNFLLPEMTQQGRGAEIFGPFDGNASNTTLMFGPPRSTVQDFEKNIENVSRGFGLIRPLAESPRKIVFEAPTNVAGPIELYVKEGAAQAAGTCQNVGLRLTAGNTNLLKGEKTTLTTEVNGLQGIKKPVPLTLEAKGAITMDGGMFQQLLIQPSQVTNGTYVTTRGITGVQPGVWSATSTVVTQPFNIILRDPDPPQTLLFNSFTGDYIFCSPQGKFGGTAKMKTHGCTADFGSNQKDHQLNGAINLCNPVDNGRYWVFYWPGITVDFQTTVTDPRVRRIRMFSNLDKLAPPVQDTSAFATCP